MMENNSSKELLWEMLFVATSTLSSIFQVIPAFYINRSCNNLTNHISAIGYPSLLSFSRNKKKCKKDMVHNIISIQKFLYCAHGKGVLIKLLQLKGSISHWKFCCYYMMATWIVGNYDSLTRYIREMLSQYSIWCTPYITILPLFRPCPTTSKMCEPFTDILHTCNWRSIAIPKSQ